MAFASAAARDGGTAPRPLPPVDSWTPPYCGDIGLRIARDGAWLHQGSPIRRERLVRLFSTILRKDPDRYLLVTPVESILVEVEDAPFVAYEMTLRQEGDVETLVFRTNVGDEAAAGPLHPLRFERGAAEGIKPYVHIRGGLWALLSRTLAAELLERGQTRLEAGREVFGVSSGGVFFPLADATKSSESGRMA